MPMIVANNLNALSTERALNKNNGKLTTSLERLSTGYKINSGKDDPSGLVISEQLRAQNVGLERAVQNTQEANNVLGIAEGALNENEQHSEKDAPACCAFCQQWCHFTRTGCS